MANHWTILNHRFNAWFSGQDKRLDLVDKISENGRNIYEWNQINQSILEIDFDWTL